MYVPISNRGDEVGKVILGISPQLGPLAGAQGVLYLINCSDGLTNLVNDEELLKIVKKEKPKKACEKLIQLANKRGGDDNITVQILKVMNEG